MKPYASMSIDLDNQWTYMKIHGDRRWSEFPSYLHLVVPYLLDLFEEMDLRLTWFLVGRDARIRGGRGYLRLIPDFGHEVGNHSFHHEPWLTAGPGAAIEQEIMSAHEAIVEATGQEPVGFRAPGYSWTQALADTLTRIGYRFDASCLPTFIGPFARWFYFKTAKLSPEERRQRADLFGHFADGFQRLRPHVFGTAGNRYAVEIPVTTMPVLRVPFHMSYLLYLYRKSQRLMTAYLRTAIALCRIWHVSPSFLLHPLDFLDGSQVPELRFFPAMDIDRDRKLAAFRTVIAELKSAFTLIPMSIHASLVLDRSETSSGANASPVSRGSSTQAREAVQS